MIIQTLYSTPGITQPSGEVTDDDLITTWKKSIEERIKLKEKIESLKEKLKTNENNHTETIEGIKCMEIQLSEIKVYNFFLFFHVLFYIPLKHV